MSNEGWITDPQNSDSSVKIGTNRIRETRSTPFVLIAVDKNVDQRVWVGMSKAELTALRDQITALLER